MSKGHICGCDWVNNIVAWTGSNWIWSSKGLFLLSCSGKTYLSQIHVHLFHRDIDCQKCIMFIKLNCRSIAWAMLHVWHNYVVLTVRIDNLPSTRVPMVPPRALALRLHDICSIVEFVRICRSRRLGPIVFSHSNCNVRDMGLREMIVYV